MAHIALLEEARDYFAKIDRQFINMDRWAKFKSLDGDCMTAACFAGWCTTNPNFKKMGLVMTRRGGEFDDMGCIRFQGFRDSYAIAKFFDITEDDAEYITMPDAYDMEPSQIPKEEVITHINEIIAKYKE